MLRELRRGCEAMLTKGLEGTCFTGKVVVEHGENGGGGDWSKADKALT